MILNKLIDIETNDRKSWSLWLMFGGAVVFTIYAFIGLFMVSNIPSYVFWLAVIAHIQIFSIMCGYIAQLVKRRIAISKEGVSITDIDDALKLKDQLLGESNNGSKP